MRELIFFLNYILIRIATFPFAFMPYRVIHQFGKFFGNIAYYLIPKYRKRALSNLALAKNLNLSNKQTIKYAKESFQNLATVVLEYSRFNREKNFAKVIKCENPKTANNLHRNSQGIIFFCGHQANWEVLFLHGNLSMRGIAIGKPIKNPFLYRWIVSIREKTGGKMISPNNALKEGLKNLKKGLFMGIVGDQGKPDSPYFFSFFGRRGWTSSAPALLAYKTKCPIIVATTKREKGKYIIHYSDPIWPDQNISIEKETKNLMDKTLSKFEKSILKFPGQYLWQHNRYKQQTPHLVMKKYRLDSIAIILPKQKEAFINISKHLLTLKKIYRNNFLFLFIPKNFSFYHIPESEEIIYYKKIHDILKPDFRYKLVFDFYENKKIKNHFLKFSAFNVLRIKDLQKEAKKHNANLDISDLSSVFYASLCRNKS